MYKYSECLLLLLFNGILMVSSKSYYTVIAPGIIKSNHNYTVCVTLHEADGPANIRLRINGPEYFMDSNVDLQPMQSMLVEFGVPKLADGKHKLLADGSGGIQFHNESRLEAFPNAKQKIYIQTDKAIYKPGDVVQFRVVMLDVHTRPLYINEPIRVEILDVDDNRVKQFKDISLMHGIYTGKFQLSEYPTLGSWKIKVIISGQYDESHLKVIHVMKYILPKFNVYIKADENLILDDGHLKALVYAKYTFDKYVEGNATVRLTYSLNDEILKEKSMNLVTTGVIEFTFSAEERKRWKTFHYRMWLTVDFTEKYTGVTRSTKEVLYIRQHRYYMDVDTDSIKYRHNIPYRLKVSVRHWNGGPVWHDQTLVSMEHGPKEYEAHLNHEGQTLFHFDYYPDANYVFRYGDISYTLPNIYVETTEETNNQTLSHCQIFLKDGKIRLGKTLRIKVTCMEVIPYLKYIVVGHANIIQSAHIIMPPGIKSDIFEITPSIEMIPISYIYVYYVLNGQLRYDELKLSFPLEFQNKVSIAAPTHVEPGQNVTIELQAHPNSYVGLMAVDLGVYLLDSSYDLQGDEIMKQLQDDQTYSPINALVYPGLLSGLLTLTNAHYRFVPGPPREKGLVGGPKMWNFRKKFPETWIFENYEITNKTTHLNLTVPDSITTWRLTAFTVNDVTGFGIVDGPTDIVARKTFFITLNLPYSVKRGEIVDIPVIVYNYHNQNVNTEITFYNDDQEFYFTQLNQRNDEVNAKKENIRLVRQRVVVPADGAEKISFYIVPQQVGDISLRITAENSLSSDALIQKLKVEPEGVAQRHNKPFYVSLAAGETFSTSYQPEIPLNIVPNSEYLKISASTDSMVPTLTNLNDLVLLPTGCGEQNMVNFAPNILVLQYLKATGKYYKERNLVGRAKEFVEIGYQQQLAFRHENGGYSVFGRRLDEVSTWLTAYVIRFFIKAQKYVPIEARIIESGMEFLAENQYEAGNFPYTGYLFYPAQQNRYGFTAFVLMTFLEDTKYANKYRTTIAKGLQFLNNNLEHINDIYALAIVATALKMAQHDNALRVIDKLKQKKSQSADGIWWSQNDRNSEKDVEITAYALMALLDNNNDSRENKQILKWLLDQRNEKGGFHSSQDTVVGLQALVKFSEKYRNPNNVTLNIEYTAKDNKNKILQSKQLKLDRGNVLVLQTKELPKSTRLIDLKATGSGNALIQISHHYHTNLVDNAVNYFNIEPQASMLNPSELQLSVCFDLLRPIISPDGRKDVNMILMEINLPSGFVMNESFAKDLINNDIVQRVELKNSDTTVIVYLEKLSANVGNCLDVLADKVSDVLRRKSSAIVVYDYYNNTRTDTALYDV